MARSLFGTSMPTACLPGMGATMRTREAARRRAMLSERFAIFETFTPGGGQDLEHGDDRALADAGHLGV